MWQKEYGEQTAAQSLVKAAESLPRVGSLSDFEDLCMAIAAVPLPVGVFSEGARSMPQFVDEQTSPPLPAELTVAFLKFQIDGQAAGSIHHLTPLVLHDLEIEVRITLARICNNAEAVPYFNGAAYQLRPLRVRLRQACGRTTVHTSPAGRAALQLAQGMSARPYEFKYSAAFEPVSSEQPVAIVGHRTLLIEGLDVRSNPITGYPMVDEKILSIRDFLRRNGLVNSTELSDVLEVVKVLGGWRGALSKTLNSMVSGQRRSSRARFARSFGATLKLALILTNIPRLQAALQTSAIAVSLSSSSLYQLESRR